MSRLFVVGYAVMNPDFEDQKIGRVEIIEEGEQYSSREGRISAPRRVYDKLVEALDEVELKGDEEVLINLNTRIGGD